MVLWLLEVQLTEFAELRRNGKQTELGRAESTREGTSIEQQIKNMRQQIELFLARSVVLVSVIFAEVKVNRRQVSGNFRTNKPFQMNIQN